MHARLKVAAATRLAGAILTLSGVVLAGAALVPSAAALASTRPAVVLAVSPTRTEVAPSTHSVVMHVASRGSQPVAITASVLPLVQDADGDLALGSQPPQYGQAWLTVVPARFTLNPGQTVPVTVRIKIPPRQGGQRYLAVVFRANGAGGPSSGGSSATIAGAVASSLIIDIPGQIRHQTSLALSAPGFSAGGPVTLNLTISNHGNAYALENHLSVVSGGKSVSAFAGSLVLAGATRQETVTWTGAPALCICRLRLAGTNRTVTVIRFPVLPVIGGLLVALALAVLLTLYTRTVRRRAVAAAVHDAAATRVPADVD
jgi:P pilus assembly chaperone PapD